MARPPAARSPRQRGVTLIEALAVVAILAIVSAVAAPGMRAFAMSQRAKTLSYDLVADLLVARSEALKRNAAVTVAPIGTSWSGGWRTTSGALVLSQRQADGGSLAFDAAPTAITFNVFGRVGSPADPVRMTVRAADTGADVNQRCVELDPAGYPRSRMGACK